MRIPAVLALLCPLAASPAWADAIYKWVDDQGVVHYSNTRPVKQKVEIVTEDRVSTVQSEPAATRPSSSGRADTDYLVRRVDLLERELAAQRQAVQAASAAETRAMQADYEDCLASRRVDCNGGYGPPAVIYGGPIVPVRRAFARNHRFHPARNITGLTAGNVVTFSSPRSGGSFRR